MHPTTISTFLDHIIKRKILFTTLESIIALYLHDGLQIRTPDLLGFSHSAAVHFIGISCF